MNVLGRWVLAGCLSGALLGGAVDPTALPFIGHEQISAVFLSDGQAYFGHLDDVPWSGTLTLRDVYYLQDAQKTTTNLTVGLQKRGTEIHQPADRMQIERSKVLAVERVAQGSPVAVAIAVQRSLDRLQAVK